MTIRISSGLVVALWCVSGFCQTFTVQSRVGSNQLTLDDTIFVSYVVQLSGATSTINNVVATLTPPACATVNIGGENYSIFSATYGGYKNGASFVNAPIPSWSNTTTKEVGFYVHLYDNLAGAGSICTNLCPGQVQFNLEFTWEDVAQASVAGASSQLQFLRPDDNVVTIVERASHLSSSLPSNGFIGHSDEFNWPLSVTNPFATNMSDPNVRVYLAFDWYLFGNSPTSVWDFFVYPVTNNCAINHLNFVNNQLTFHTGTLIDGTGEIPGTQNGIIPLAALGGAGGVGAPAGSGWNFYDITNFAVPCGGTARSRLGYPSPPYWVTIDVFLVPVIIRDVGIWIGIQGSCQPLSAAFGPPTEDFKFTELHTDNRGNVQARLSVPTLWKSGADLSSSYSISWFARNNSTIIPLTDINGDGVKLTLDSTSALQLPSNFQIEARIRHTASGDQVSIKSPVHGFSYVLGAESFVNAEAIPDVYLDPGETAVFPYQVFNNSGENATGLSIDVGAEFAGMGTEVFVAATALPSNLASGQNSTSNTSFELLLGPDCSEVSLYAEVTHTRDTFTSSHRNYFVIGSNCEDTNITEFRSISNWTPTPVASKRGGGGWSYAQGSWTGTATDDVQLYTLESPVVNTGLYPNFDLTHLPNLPLNLAGGVLEYATSTNGTNWTGWADLVLLMESFQGSPIYHNLVFPNNISSYIANRRVWMYLNPPASPQVAFVDRPINPNAINPLVDKFIRFRFAFQAPYLGQQEGANPTWEIESFNFTSQQPFEDDYFGVGNNLFFFSCESWIVNISTPGSFQADWYETVQDLIDDTPTYTNQSSTGSIEWDMSRPSPLTDTTYYVRLTQLSTQTQRVIAFDVNVPQGGVPPLGAIVADWRILPAAPGSDLNVDGSVDVLDYAFRENEDVCE